MTRLVCHTQYPAAFARLLPDTLLARYGIALAQQQQLGPQDRLLVDQPGLHLDPDNLPADAWIAWGGEVQGLPAPLVWIPHPDQLSDAILLRLLLYALHCEPGPGLDILLPSKVGELPTLVVDRQHQVLWANAGARRLGTLPGLHLELQSMEALNLGTPEQWFIPVAEGWDNLLFWQLAPVTELYQDWQENQQQRTLLEQALEGSGDSLWVWDVQQNRLHFSANWYKQTGLPDVPGIHCLEDWLEMIEPSEREHFEYQLNQHLHGDSTSLRLTYKLKRTVGLRDTWMQCRGRITRDEEGQLLKIVGHQTDVSHDHTETAELRQQAVVDTLTGLPNKSQFIRDLEHALTQQHQDPEHLYALLFLDLDEFKAVNDSLGHVTGDRLLVKIARRLRQSIRHQDIAARLGGDEFAVIIKSAESAESIGHVSQRILDDLCRPYQIDQHELQPSFSLGIALMGDYQMLEPLLRDADTAMYCAKRRGHNQISFFTPTMHEASKQRLKISHDLRHALQQEQLCLYYQPIWQLEPRQLHGFECLIRWPHPELGLIMPGDFLPMCNELGLINQLTLFTLHQAARQLCQWQQSDPQFNGYLSVNLSPQCLMQDDLVQQLLEINQKYQLPEGRLRLEITEDTLLHKSEHTRNVLAACVATGYQIYLDDLGTGYSSLSYLLDFPIQAVKIDRSFIAGLPDNERSLKIVKAILGLADSCGIKVIAEGIETPEQQRLLEQLGCHCVQGFYLGKPRPVEQLQDWLALACPP
ncbi:putative bifunctional diguanylate cyclase/phosphodiesterase [Balneatrix alpica]|uniref:putative bifunctional diguanylate cyclase/phosphodiesterase n=1 Tax=Balneatrix alpica TaxID=75684 RepID=UPI0027391407|nr:GGDEF domain-containing phosphodiesterase [Balneatrix alpica]